MSRWFRAYDDAVDDPKLQRLPGEMFKALFNLWCLTSKNDGVLPPLDEIAFKLRIKVEKAKRVLNELRTAGLIEDDETGSHPHNWNGRQFRSDTNSNERVKRYRERRKAAGLDRQWAPSQEFRSSIYKRDGFKCVYCGKSDDLTIDHRTPELRGGTHDLSNLQTCCRICNASKRDMTHEEFVSRNGGVTLLETQLKRHQSTETDSDSVAKATAAEVVGEEPRAKLFRIGKTILVSFGITEKRTGSLLGQWLKSRNDPIGLLAAIQYARDQNVAEPIAYISTLVSAKEKSNGQHKLSLSDQALELADEVRERERAAGLQRPDDAVGSHRSR